MPAPSIAQWFIVIFLSAINTGLLSLVALRMIHVFQLEGYRAKGFLRWAVRDGGPFVTSMFFLALLGTGGAIIVNLLFNNFTNLNYVSNIGLALYFGFAGYLGWKTLTMPRKTPLKFTPRVWRLLITNGTLMFILSVVFGLIWFGDSGSAFMRTSLIAITPLLIIEILLLAYIINKPMESQIRKSFIKKAKKKLESPEYANLIRVGITGSYGKTSCKDILVKMMEQRFKVAASPASYNTPMGFARTVNEILNPSHEVMIFEMGLRYKTDIKYLAEVFMPHHGILTAIGNQHIETMGSIEAIKNEKAELLRALPFHGIAVLNGENEKCIEVFSELELTNKFLVSEKEGIVTASDISVSEKGGAFTLKFDNKKVACTTKLLGKHNIQNILMCATMAYKLGVSPEQITIAIADLAPTPHRLELITAPSGMLILDDSYNANESGMRAALEVLSLFKGKKVVQTPGIVEQGEHAHETNKNIGMQIAKVADEVIIINETNREAISEGLKAENFQQEKIHLAKNLDETKLLYPKILSSGDILLIANDLPDNFK